MLFDFIYKCIFSFVLPVIIWAVFGNLYIEFLKKKQANHSTIRKYVPDSHLKKIGTPTMGGVLIIFSVLLSCCLFGDLSNRYLLLLIYLMVSYFFIGFFDDFFKLYVNNTSGLSAKLKFFLEVIVSFIFLCFLKDIQGDVLFSTISFKPFVNLSIYIGVVYFVFAILVISGTSNAVNLTDGLDGLVSIPSIIAYCFFACTMYIVSDISLAQIFSLNYIENIRELIIMPISFIGAITGFFIFNKKPARIFMGDSGSLPIGAVLGGIALILKQELILFFVGLVFVIEALSVIIQVTYFKLTGKRFFLMAPIHHHFEKLGFAECNIVRCIWLFSLTINILLFMYILR